MRTVLIVLEDTSLLNRIKIILHDRTAQFFFAQTGDEAVEIMEKTEIAVTMVSLSMPVMNGAELIELFLNKNPRMQILLLFREADTERTIQLHNKYHLCSVLCRDFLALDELPKHIEDALFAYNKNDELKKIEIAYREKEEKYKKTMFEMSALLNDRMESYQEIIKLFVIYENYVLRERGNTLSESTRDSMISYQEQILQNFVQLYLLREPDQQSFFENIEEKYNRPGIKKYFKIINEVSGAFAKDTFHHISFLISALTFYFNQFYSEYRGKIVITQNEQFYLVNLVYDVKKLEELNHAGELLLALNEKLVSAYTAKAAYGSKDSVMQFKLYFAKSELEEA